MKPEIVFNETDHTYFVDGVQVPSVTDILAPLHRSYGKVNPSVLEYAAKRGSAVHEALELIDYGEDPEVYPETIGYINAYEDWKNVYKPEWLGIEKIVFCEEGWFIGTLDRVGILNGDELAVVDIKTSTPNRESYVSVCLQTMAYAMAYSSHTDFEADWQKMSRYGLFLMKDGSWRCINCEEWEGTNHIVASEAFTKLLFTHKMITKLLETRKRK